MRSIIEVGMSLSATKLFNPPKGLSSTNMPMRLPSSPRIDMRDALPMPPVLRTVTPTVRASTSLTFVAVPSNCRLPMTDTGKADSFSCLILFFPKMVTPCSVLLFACRPMLMQMLSCLLTNKSTLVFFVL